MEVKPTICENCGCAEKEHWALNWADGQHVSGSVLVCPTATFRLQRGAKRKENPPHGPVSERIMRHAYGAKR